MMTNLIQQSPIFSICYEIVGRATPRNQSLIIVLRFPEYPLLGTRGNPRPTLDKEILSR